MQLHSEALAVIEGQLMLKRGEQSGLIEADEADEAGNVNVVEAAFRASQARSCSKDPKPQTARNRHLDKAKKNPPVIFLPVS